MSRLVDTTICPDCRGALDPTVTCTACGLQVRGPLALQLWDAMVVADGLIQRLRWESAPAPVPQAQPQSQPQLQPQGASGVTYPTHPGTQLRPPPQRKPSRLPFTTMTSLSP